MHKRFRIAGQPWEDFCRHGQEGQEGIAQQVIDFLARWTDGSEHITVHTSGSTGAPKGLEIPKKWMIASALKTGEYLGLEAGHKALLCLPPRYIGGMMMIVRALQIGMDLRLEEPSLSLRSTGAFDFAAMTPPQVSHLLTSGDDLNRFKRLIIGGAAVSPKLARQLSSYETAIYSSYGMTETVSHIALMPLSKSPASLEFEALDGVSLSLDQRGALHIRVAYLDDLELQTQDVVALTSERRFQYLGRIDHVINSGGLKIHPERLEAALAPWIDHPFFVHHEPDELLGQGCILIIETDQALSVAEALREQIEALGPAKPQSIYRCAALHRTPNGKIKRSLDGLPLTQIAAT